MKVPWFRHRFLVRRRLDRLFLDLPDAALRRLTGRSELPPYSLRSFVGGARDFDLVGTAFLEEFERLKLFSKGTRVLDVGCGCGRIARTLALNRRLQQLEVVYSGMDIDRESVEWCQRHITPINDRFTFYQADCINRSYNPLGSTTAAAYIFPHPDAAFDLILLTSVMTHLLEDDLRHYLAEVSRMLAPGGVAYASFFLYQSLGDAAAGSVRHGIRFPFARGNYAVNREDYPANAVAYLEPYLRQTVAETGLELIEPILYGVQDVLLMGKAPGTYVEPLLGRGWHELEQGCCRWTERAFAITLQRPDRKPDRKQLTLRFRFSLPAAIMDGQRGVQLSAHIDGVPLPSAAFSAAGDHLYICPIPDSLWVDDSVVIQFELDKACASAADLRELGIHVAFAEGAGPLQRRLEPFALSERL